MASEREKSDKSKINNQIKHIPKDAQVIMSILKEIGITDYEPRVINQLLEFTYRKKLSKIEKKNLNPTFFLLILFCKQNVFMFFFSRVCYMHIRRC